MGDAFARGDRVGWPTKKKPVVSNKDNDGRVGFGGRAILRACRSLVEVDHLGFREKPVATMSAFRTSHNDVEGLARPIESGRSDSDDFSVFLAEFCLTLWTLHFSFLFALRIVSSLSLLNPNPTSNPIAPINATNIIAENTRSITRLPLLFGRHSAVLDLFDECAPCGQLATPECRLVAHILLSNFDLVLGAGQKFFDLRFRRVDDNAGFAPGRFVQLEQLSRASRDYKAPVREAHI